MSVIFALYLLSGLFKSFFHYFGISIPIDFTILCAMLLVLGIITDNIRPTIYLRRTDQFFILSILLFFCFAGFTLIYSASGDYKFEKTIQLATVVLGAISPFLFRSFNYKKFLRVFSYSSAFLSVIYIVIINLYGFQSKESDPLLYTFSSLYLSLSFSAGLSALLIFFDKKNFPDIERNVVFVVLILCMLFLGARGPLLFFILSIMIFKIYPLLKSKIKFILNGLVISTFLVLLGFLSIPFIYEKSIMVQRTFERFGTLIGDTFGSSETSHSISARLDGLKFSLESIFSSWSNLFLGEGIGSFGILYEQIDERQHPHNILAEIWFELGLIGLGIFILTILLPLISSLKNKYLKVVPTVALIYILLNYLKSSSYSETRIGFAILALFILVQTIAKKKPEKGC